MICHVPVICRLPIIPNSIQLRIKTGDKFCQPRESQTDYHNCKAQSQSNTQRLTWEYTGYPCIRAIPVYGLSQVNLGVYGLSQVNLGVYGLSQYTGYPRLTWEYTGYPSIRAIPGLPGSIRAIPG
ncbi:hypothetical protein DdX_11855 [Ditylenchus destructor]|uniref:Uncharacterized protein n=1 Tax=Ditylenchus destructor TaxID=166010 RepID=A0AAD4N1I7_9BILA|nr:hypothetical protein DdX_11855 [Ditylenchus destructor]